MNAKNQQPDDAEEFDFPNSMEDVWAKLEPNLKLKNAINRYADQRWRRKRLTGAGIAALLLMITVLMGVMNRFNLNADHIVGMAAVPDTLKRQEKGRIKLSMRAHDSLPVIMAKVPGKENRRRDSVPLFQPGSHPLMHVKENFPFDQVMIPEKEDSPKYTVILVAHAAGEKLPSKKVNYKTSGSIDENDIWEVTQRAVNKAYWRKQKLLKDSITNPVH